MLIPILLFFFTFVVYLRTSCASFNINDSGETIMVCDLLTISHSPGYPLHALWGRFNCLLPLGSPMFRVTFSSLLTGTISVVLVYFILKLMLKGIFDPFDPSKPPLPEEQKPGPWLWEVPAVFGALVFAFSFQQWFQACGAKGGIYTLNTMLSLFMVLLFFTMRQRGWFLKSFWLLGFVYSLGWAHHWPNFLVMTPCFFWMLITSQKRIPLVDFLKMSLNVVNIFIFILLFAVNLVLCLYILKPILVIDTPAKVAFAMSCYEAFGYICVRIFGGLQFTRYFTFGLIGFLTYLYLPIRSIQNPVVNWWHPQDLQRLFDTVFRKGYQDIGDKRNLDTMLRVFDRFMLHGHNEYGDIFTALVFLLAFWGIYWLFRRQWASAVALSLFGGGLFGAIMVFNNPLEGYQWTVDNFFTPVFMIGAMFAAVGMAGICEWIVTKWPLREVPLYTSAICMSFALMPLILNYTVGEHHYSDLIPYKGSSSDRMVYQGNDQSRYVCSYDEGMNMLKTVNDDGVIICNGDIDILPLWYLQFVEGKRPKVVSFTMQLIPYDWYRDPLFKRWPFLAVPIRKDVYGRDAIQPEVVVQDMIDQHAQDRSFYFTNIFTAAWMRDKNPAIPDGFLWRIVKTKNLNYPFTSARLNGLWDTYRLRNMDLPDRGYWDEYTDVMKDSYGIGHDFTGYFCLMNQMPDIALWSFNNALKYRQAQTLSRIYMMLGETYMALNNASAAINSYQESIKEEQEKDPHSALIPYNLAKMGYAFMASKDYADAESAFRSSLAANPQQKEALTGLQQLSDLQQKNQGQDRPHR
jgi:hypothetical protein